MNSTPSQIEVVAAVVIRNNSVLLARRSEGSLRGYWEFPGGKVEVGESHSKALARELQEELRVSCSVGAFAGESEHKGVQATIRLFFYYCELYQEPTAGDSHDAIEWVPISLWRNYKVAPADIPILEGINGRIP